ncbi:TetR/AcrR family transcriptional regulator [Paenibacillus naphthalenovorans]|uniref:TetR/AcrR family transcriptional regulator n=1 Tax=Paenibacillus naphthalenovorans TaxID=162209 RepID=UPI003D2CC58B
MDQNTFEFILSTTEQLIKEKGCQQTTLQDIMERTGLSKGAIYHYVKSKDELYGKILLGYMEELNHSFHEAVNQSKDKDVRKPVQALVSSFAEREVSNLIFIYLLSQRHNMKTVAILEEVHQNSLLLSETWIKVGQEHGAIPADVDAKSFASMFVTLSYGLRINQLLDKNPDRQAAKLQDMFRLIVGALKKSEQ